MSAQTVKVDHVDQHFKADQMLVSFFLCRGCVVDETIITEFSAFFHDFGDFDRIPSQEEV